MGDNSAVSSGGVTALSCSPNRPLPWGDEDSRIACSVETLFLVLRKSGPIVGSLLEWVS